ncbi:MAG: pantoate--beta-alanine ligase [Angustibacter sp.]
MSHPRLLSSRSELRELRSAWTSQTVGLVPTMGALHAGHAELIRRARDRSDVVIVSIFVNPLQFGPTEDLSRYPRTLDGDRQLCSELGVDLVFAPSVGEMYPDGQPEISLSAGALGRVLEGRSRPGHFDGVLTVVAKLLLLCRPDYAFFGEKDAQQLLLIRRMVADLDFGPEVIAVPTIRDADGLALSSRNRRLSPAERAAALSLSRALRRAEGAIRGGPGAVVRAAEEELRATPGVLVDYLALVDPRTLAPIPASQAGQALLAIAATIGNTRLIDNALLDFPELPRNDGEPHEQP